MRHSYIVTYDICDPKRLRLVYKTMRDWGVHLQYSVFECQLTKLELSECRSQLEEVIHHREDQVLFIQLGPAESRGEWVIDAIGQAYHPIDAACYVV